MQIAVDHRCAESFGQGDAVANRIRHHHAAAGQNHRELGFSEQGGGCVQTLLAARAAFNLERRGDLRVHLAVEEVPRDVQLGRADV